MRQILLLALLLASVPALATDYYVRTDGNDVNCTGTTDAAYTGGGIGSACAKRTIVSANLLAGCGDTVNIGAGEFYETNINITDTCTSGNEKVFAGAGATTIVHALNRNITSCEAYNSIYRCSPPTGFQYEITASNIGPQYPVYMSDVISAYYEDTNGTKGTMSDYVSLTWFTTLSGAESTEGSAYYDGSTWIYVNPWDGLDPTAGETTIYACIDNGPEDGIDGGFDVQGDYITIRDMTVVGGNGHSSISMKATADNLTVSDVTTYLSPASTASGSTNYTVTNYSSFNGYRHTNNAGEWAGVSLSIQSDGFTMTNVESAHAREGCSFSGSAANGTVNGLECHGHHNHVLKLIDGVHDIDFYDVLTYNGQEPLFISCAYNIQFINADFTFGTDQTTIQGLPGGGCPAGTLENIDFINSKICRLHFFIPYGDTWAEGGHDLLNNTFVTAADGGSCTGTTSYILRAGGVNYTEADLNTDNLGSCSNCVLNNNNTDEVADLWTNYCYRNEATCTNDYQPPNGTNAAVNNGDAAYSDSEDIIQNGRVNAPDSGAYEWQGSQSAVCDDGVDNDGDGDTDYPADSGCDSAADNDERECGDDYLDTNEECDTSQLDGETCASLGFGGGTLGCSGSCTFDTSSCSPVPVEDTMTLRGDIFIRGSSTTLEQK